MRNPRRIARVLEQLRAYWELNPDLRLGQIVANLTPERFTRGADGLHQTNPSFHVEDEEWESILRDELRRIAKTFRI